MSDQSNSGGTSSYYMLEVTHPMSFETPYMVECIDIINTLGMTFAEGEAFEALWRRAGSRTLKKEKLGYDDGLRDAEKVEYYGHCLVVQSRK